MSFLCCLASFLLAVWFCIYTHAQLRILKFQNSVIILSSFLVLPFVNGIFSRIFLKFGKFWINKNGKGNYFLINQLIVLPSLKKPLGSSLTNFWCAENFEKFDWLFLGDGETKEHWLFNCYCFVCVRSVI